MTWSYIHPSQCCHDTWCGLHAGASSGLHHDFHDNLYVLLRGRKRFRLYSPDHAKRMYTHGRIAKVHANGRIVYADQASGRSAVMRNSRRSGVLILSQQFALPGACVACIRLMFLVFARRKQDDTNADGSGVDEAAAWRERVAAESDVAAAQQAVQRNAQASSSILLGDRMCWHTMTVC